MRLYELTTAYQTLETEDSEAFAAALDQLQEAIADKAVNVAKVIRNLEAEEQEAKAEADRLSQRAKSLGNRCDALKEYLLLNMKVAKVTNLTSPLFTIFVRPPSKVVFIENEALIPDEYKETKTEVRKGLIAAALKEKKEVPGASLVDGKEALVIR